MITNTPNKVLPLLRNATAELHKKLDESLPISSSSPTIEDYSQHLMWFKEWLSHIEKIIAGGHTSLTEFTATNSTALHLLEHDLQALRIESVPASAAFESPANLNAAYYLGVEYVVKGSALGSAMLYGKISQLFPTAPIEFMKDSMTHGKERWKKFLVKLEAHEWTEDDILSAQQGSIWAFQQYIKLHDVATQHS
jgi:heme oxygenase (biliverdin-IX-beta and delta-forming)